MKIPNKLQTFQASLTKKQRVLLLVAVAVVVLGLLTATVFRSNVASVLRWMTYSQADDNFAHNAQSSSLFLGMGDNLLICTKTQIQLFSPTGTLRMKESVEMKSPALNASGDYAVVYDVGGQELRLVGDETILHSLTLPAEETFLCATVNEKGWVAVTTKVSGYKGVVTVYNRDFEPVLTIRLSSRYISDAVVTPDCRGSTSSPPARQMAPSRIRCSITPSPLGRNPPVPFPWGPTWSCPSAAPAGAGFWGTRAW